MQTPALFFPEGFSYSSTPLPPKDKETGNRLWDQWERPDFCKKTKDYFGSSYGSSFNIPMEWIVKAVQEKRDFRVKLNELGDLVEC